MHDHFSNIIGHHNYFPCGKNIIGPSFDTRFLKRNAFASDGKAMIAKLLPNSLLLISHFVDFDDLLFMEK